MDEYTYKNTSKATLTVPHVGVVEPGKSFTTSVELSNHDLELTKKRKVTKEAVDETRAAEGITTDNTEESK